MILGTLAIVSALVFLAQAAGFRPIGRGAPLALRLLAPRTDLGW